MSYVNVKEKYIGLCHDVKKAKTEQEFQTRKLIAQTYSDAIQDICGISVWASIVREADLSFQETDIICAGILISFNEKTK